MLNTSLSDGNAQAALSGQLTFTDHGAFRDAAHQLVASQAQRLVVEVGGLEFIDSAGLGMLLLLREEAGATGRPVVLRNAQGQVKRMFTVSRFDTLFIVEP